MSDLSNKVILTVATTGSSTTKKSAPNIPFTPEEIAEDAYECWKAGASVLHLHVRDDEGKATMSYEKFEETVKRVRDKCDIVINMTTAGGFGVSNEDRIKPLDLMPEMATLDAGSMNVAGDFVFHNSLKFLEDAGNRMKELGIKPEIEVMDPSMIYTGLKLVEDGIIKNPPHFQMVMGMNNGIKATVDNLLFMKNLLPENATWSAFGIGASHLTILMGALAMNGHVRVGFEDNVYLSKGVKAERNVQFVERTKQIIELTNKSVATPNEVREMFKLRAY